MTEIIIGVNKEYKAGNATITWEHGEDFYRPMDFSALIVDIDGINKRFDIWSYEEIQKVNNALEEHGIDARLVYTPSEKHREVAEMKKVFKESDTGKDYEVVLSRDIDSDVVVVKIIELLKLKGIAVTRLLLCLTSDRDTIYANNAIKDYGGEIRIQGDINNPYLVDYEDIKERLIINDNICECDNISKILSKEEIVESIRELLAEEWDEYISELYAVAGDFVDDLVDRFFSEEEYVNNRLPSPNYIEENHDFYDDFYDEWQCKLIVVDDIPYYVMLE